MGMLFGYRGTLGVPYIERAWSRDKRKLDQHLSAMVSYNSLMYAQGLLLHMLLRYKKLRFTGMGTFSELHDYHTEKPTVGQVCLCAILGCQHCSVSLFAGSQEGSATHHPTRRVQ